MAPNQESHRHGYPPLKWIGHILGLLYLLITLLFGPIKSLAAWLGRQQVIERYRGWVASLPPASGLGASLLSLSLLEVSKLAVLLTFRHFGLAAAVVVTFCAKASFGYFAHTTWQAARPKVIATYSWAARLDAWVMTWLARLRGLRDRWVNYPRRFWHAGLIGPITLLRKHTARMITGLKAKLARTFDLS
ncbi:MAG: hypothetical protein IPK63_07385 [Candidatus Competibacteraceae bacterium]|nr:hypothetical protein [Candidatus Competibacteraceae bacterium]